ncbi:hypothetical protein [Aureimonas psammosilenae]|uniref:hypothetical protein n=1 Tax=Aureimonas psammosilenae TaxID=2495496 RepID=UPI00126113F5|nr:hypothetical protein [Aureimonas psammosilenae]
MLGIGFSPALRRQRPTLVSVPPLYLAANLTRAAYAVDAISAEGNSRRESRAPFFLGGELTEIWLVYANWHLPLGNCAEVPTGNPVMLAAALELEGVTVEAPNASRAAPRRMEDGETFLAGPFRASDFGLDRFRPVADPLGPAAHFARTSMWADVGQKLPRSGQYLSEAPASRGHYSLAATHVHLTGPLAGANNGVAPSHIAVIGRPTPAAAANWRATLVIGDSVCEGQADASPYPAVARGGGYVARAHWNNGGRHLPLAQLGRHGGKLAHYRAGGAARRSMAAFATHALLAFGANDLFVLADANLASRQAALKAAWLADLDAEIAALRGAGIRHIRVAHVGPRTTSSDQWATSVNQSPQANWQADFVASVNAEIVSRVLNGKANAIDAAFDVNAHWGEGGGNAKWLVNGAANHPTGDGTHPNSALMASAGAGLAAAVAG